MKTLNHQFCWTWHLVLSEFSIPKANLPLSTIQMSSGVSPPIAGQNWLNQCGEERQQEFLLPLQRLRHTVLSKTDFFGCTWTAFLKNLDNLLVTWDAFGLVELLRKVRSSWDICQAVLHALHFSLFVFNTSKAFHFQRKYWTAGFLIKWAEKKIAGLPG